MADVVIMPKLGLTMEKGTILTWLKKEGDAVEKGEVLLEIETDKIVNQVESPFGGTLLKILAEEGAEVPVKTAIALIGGKGEDVCGHPVLQKPNNAIEQDTSSESEAGDTDTVVAGAADVGSGRRVITPRARRLIREHALPLEIFDQLRKERVTESDVERVLAERQTGKGAYTVPGELIPMSRSQKVLGERMTKSFRDIPQFSLAFRIEMDYALSMLERFPKGKGAKITLNSLIIRAAAMAFSRCPEVLHQIRGEGLFQPAEVNIGIAVAAGGKIVVPVIRNADRKRLPEIAGEAAHYIGKARNGTLQLDDVSGGTATVTNLGMFGITSFVPLVNPGESVILGVGAVQEACRAKNGSAEPFHFAQFTLVCDHRSVNGELAARFCRKLARVLETEKESAW